MNSLLRTFGTLCLVLTVRAASCSPSVKVGKTNFVGRDVSGLEQDFFGGIPYAEPPLGDLRFKPTVLKTQLDVEEYDASQFGSECLATANAPGESEDCLFLNIFRPSGIDHTAKLPVLFWTHGGGFRSGSSSEYNASAIIAQAVERGTPVLYVSINYRLGPLGFPGGGEAASKGALNLGLKDQHAALQWVQTNIEHFGGDKTKVTMFGGSAGAIMNSIQLLSPDIKKFAHAAILESGSPASLPSFDAADKESDWQTFVAGIPSCSTLSKSGDTYDCLANVDTTEIRAGFDAVFQTLDGQYVFTPTLDGEGGFLPDLPSRLLKGGRLSELPFIAGTCLDEGTHFVPRVNLAETQIRASLVSSLSPPIVDATTLSSAVDKLLLLYPDVPALGSPFNTGNETFGLPTSYKRLAAIFGDSSFQSQRRVLSQFASRAGIKTYGYLFTNPPPDTDPSLGVPHVSDKDFIYGTDLGSPTVNLFSKQVRDYFISFATSLDPNDGRGDQRPIWPQYTPQNEVLLKLYGGNIEVIPDTFRKEQIEFINSNPETWRQR